MTTKSPTASSKDSLTANPSSSYLPLPPEIRNKILSLALTGGHIYLRPSFSSPKLSHKPTSVNSNFESTPVVNLLATCRQAYNEGHVMFFSENIFHLPHGSCQEMEQLLAKIKPEHLAMMKHVVLRLSLLDLTPSVLLEVGEASPASFPGCDDISSALHVMWHVKLTHIQKNFRNLNEVRVRLSEDDKFGDEASIMVIQGPPFFDKPASIKNPPAIDTKFFRQDLYTRLRFIFAATSFRCYTILWEKQNIQRQEWEDFKNCLSPEGITSFELAGRHLQASEWSGGYWREIDIEMIAVDKKGEI